MAIPTMSLAKLDRTLKFLGDVMEVEGLNGADGKQLTHLMNLVFSPGLGQKWSGFFEADLLFDDRSVFDLVKTKTAGAKHPLVVEKVIDHGEAVIFMVTIDKHQFVLKCNAKQVSDRYQSFKEDRFVSVIEREARCYKYISETPRLKNECLALYAHGNLYEYETQGGGGTNYSAKRVWEVILMERGSEIDLYNYSASAPNDSNILNLTTRTFELLKALHKGGVSHGDVKADQFIWQSQEKVGTLEIKWLDFGRCLQERDTDKETWNLRRLMDINQLLILNPLSIASKLVCAPYHMYNMRYIRDSIEAFLTNPKWSNINGLSIRHYLLPSPMFFSSGGLYLIDQHSREYACKRFYVNEDTSFLKHIDVDGFFQFLLQDNNLARLINAFHNCAKRIGPREHKPTDNITEYELTGTAPRASNPAPQMPQQPEYLPVLPPQPLPFIPPPPQYLYPPEPQYQPRSQHFAPAQPQYLPQYVPQPQYYPPAQPQYAPAPQYLPQQQYLVYQ